MSNLVFLKALRDKLKGGNTRSIHLNALPGRYSSRLDISNLNIIEPGLAKNFLDRLLTTESFEFKISFDKVDLNSISAENQKKFGLLSKRLNSMYIENEDNYKEHGIKTFGFGYPILIKASKQDPSKIIKAPLFIWSLELVKSFNKVNTWSILRNKIRNENGKITDDNIHSISLNEVLLSHIKTDENIIIPQLNEDLLDDSIIDQSELLDECYNFLKAINSSTTEGVKQDLQQKLKNPIENLPESSSIESVTNNNPWIVFGGVFGLYRTQKESIINDFDRLIERFNSFDFSDTKVENFMGTSQSAIETDPSQQQILSTLGLDPKKIIQGPPGTGKSQSLTALITNALANNLKCLVVCEKKTALDVIKNNLHQENNQLGNLAAVIEDINKDRDGIVSNVRERLLDIGNYKNFNPSHYESVRKELEGSISLVNLNHETLARKLYRERGWTELVGEFLRRDKIASHELLKGKLQYKNFKFNKDENELGQITSKLKEAKKLFQPIGSLDHPLEVLNDEVFSNTNPQGLRLELEDYIVNTTRIIDEALDVIAQKTKEYDQWLDHHFKEYHITIKSKTDEYISSSKKNQEIFGQWFVKNDAFTKAYINLGSYFSKKYSNLKHARIGVVQKFEEIKELHLPGRYFDHHYPQGQSFPSLSIYIENIEKLATANENFSKNLENLKSDYLNRASSTKTHTKYPLNDNVWRQSEDAYVNCIKEFNETNFFSFTPSINPSVSNEIIEQGTSISTDLKIIKQHLEYFREYYAWRKFYLALSNQEKQIIESIVQTKHEDWITTFESWYYYWLLGTNDNEDLPKNDERIQELIECKAGFRKAQLNNTITNWFRNQEVSARNARAVGVNLQSLYNKRGSKGERRNSLRKIINTNFKWFTDFFPVVMTSPSGCSSLLPLEQDIFDIVIFDEASQLRLEDTYPALLRGKIKVVSGDSQQMPPSSYFQGGVSLLNPTDEDIEDESDESLITELNQKKNNALDLADSESLLVYAENSNYKQSYLKVHYRSQHPALIDFSNHAFYGKRLLPMPARHAYKPIHFIEVNGLYEDQGNRDEARQVVDILLNHIKPLNSGTFKNKLPSVGVATFNLYQRNLILEEITKARQLSPENDRKISELGPDLFVKNLENIQGDERDIMIISTTFGRKADNSFKQSFGPIIQKNGYKLLNVIITRAKYKVYICSSIPQDHIKQYPSLLQKLKNNGRAAFYAYLAYAKAISDENREVADSILNQLYENCDSKSYDIENDVFGSESPFEEEVYYRLATRIGQNRIKQQHKVGGFRIDLVVKSNQTGLPIIALECDGAKYHSSNEAYSWDMFRQKQLEQYGFTFYRIWSTNWFYSPEKELNKLVEFIQTFDKSEQASTEILSDFYASDKIIPITKSEEKKLRISTTSVVTVKNQENKILKIRFTKSKQNTIKAEKDGILSIHDGSALALALIGRTEGETCQLGMLEVYYEILKIE